MEKVLLEALQIGTPITTACQFAGITTETYYEWLRKFPDFSDAVGRSRSSAVVRLLGIIQEHAAKDWRAAESALKLIDPEHFAKVLVDQHTTLEGGEPAEQEAETIDNILKLRRAKAPKEPPAASSA